MRKSTRNYLQSIAQCKLLSQKEESELFRRYHQGDRNALAQIINANLRFVAVVAKCYSRKSSLPLSRLILAGNLGLVKAAEHFDESRGFKFIPYAAHWIRESIEQA